VRFSHVVARGTPNVVDIVEADEPPDQDPDEGTLIAHTMDVRDTTSGGRPSYERRRLNGRRWSMCGAAARHWCSTRSQGGVGAC